jgi:hypothetical protein
MFGDMSLEWMRRLLENKPGNPDDSSVPIPASMIDRVTAARRPGQINNVPGVWEAEGQGLRAASPQIIDDLRKRFKTEDIEQEAEIIDPLRSLQKKSPFWGAFAREMMGKQQQGVEGAKFAQREVDEMRRLEDIQDQLKLQKQRLELAKQESIALNRQREAQARMDESLADYFEREGTLPGRERTTGLTRSELDQYAIVQAMQGNPEFYNMLLELRKYDPRSAFYESFMEDQGPQLEIGELYTNPTTGGVVRLIDIKEDGTPVWDEDVEETLVEDTSSIGDRLKGKPPKRKKHKIRVKVR